MPTELTLHAQPLPHEWSSIAPLNALRAIAQTPVDYVMLHSGPATGASVIGFDPLCRLLVNSDGIASLAADAPLQNGIGPLPPRNPLQALQLAVDHTTFHSPHPLLGWLGFLSYDTARFLENIPPRTADDLRWPLLCFTLFRNYLIFEPNAEPQAFSLTAAGAAAPIPNWPAIPPLSQIISPGKIISPQDRSAFEAKIQRVKDYIAAGDIYQANLAQRWIIQTPAPPHAVFERLCAISPAPYAACLRFTEGATARHAVSASPELFLAAENGNAVTRPIKGTRPRDLSDAVRDAALRDELLASAKDRAELTMIVDLLRNDLGRISDYGTVQVAEPRRIEQHPTVWHTVATITSQLRENATLSEILAALCPGGSITGAPKIRAMQIIEELEGFRRALYCGNIGAIGPHAKTLALNIAIRTLLFQNNHAYLCAGGGIVADSNPAQEYDETLHKAAALFRALEIDLSTDFTD